MRSHGGRCTAAVDAGLLGGFYQQFADQAVLLARNLAVVAAVR